MKKFGELARGVVVPSRSGGDLDRWRETPVGSAASAIAASMRPCRPDSSLRLHSLFAYPRRRSAVCRPRGYSRSRRRKASTPKCLTCLALVRLRPSNGA